MNGRKMLRQLILSIMVAVVTGVDDLRVKEGPRDQKLETMSRMTLKCAIVGAPVTFRWNFVESGDDSPRVLKAEESSIVIKNEANLSILTINPVTTVDEGRYNCCGTAENGDSICAHADVEVTFGDYEYSYSNPDPTYNPVDSEPTADLCHAYPQESQGICAPYFNNGAIVHIGTPEGIQQIEEQIKGVLLQMKQMEQLSTDCARFAPQAFCHYLLPTCLADNRKQQLCRSDCEMLRYSNCDKEFERIKALPSTHHMKLYDSQFKCDMLPEINEECTSIGLPPVLKKSDTCYRETGIGYRGGANTTVNGNQCLKWEDAVNDKKATKETRLFTIENFPVLSGGHKFCRNPVNAAVFPEAKMDRPWCFVKAKKGAIVAEECELTACEPTSPFTQEALMVLLPSIATSLVLMLITIMYCVCRRRKPADKEGLEVGSNRQESLLQQANTETTYMNASVGNGHYGQNYEKLKLPELTSQSVVLRTELGEAYYGAVYLADVLPNLLYSPNHPCAAKTLSENTNTKQVHQFWREMEMLSEMRHDRIANLRAVIIQPQLRAMIFEYTDLGDLKSFLQVRNPNSDMPASAPPLTLDQQIDICHQICSGMEYLSSGEQPYIHRDLAARNILIDSNLQIKISNINIWRMEWKNDYYNPHEAMAARDNESFAEPSQSLIPVRWMSPESLLTAKYNMASDVWSYAVCCWEIFSLGTQPWLGYTNEEVMEIVIDRKQVLPCPEPCPLQLYNLLINCWAYQANSRPAFVRISGFLDQFRKSAKENPRKQYTAASTVSYNSQPYGAKNMYHQQVYSQQLPSSTDNSTVGVPPFMPGGVGCGGGVGSSIILPTPSPSHQMVQSRHQAPPASPAARNGVFSM